MSDSAKRVIERIIDDLVNKGQFAKFDELISDRIVSHDPTEPGPIVGGDAYRAAMQATRAALANLQVRIDDFVVDGNKVAYRWTATARHVGELHGIAASGKDVEFSGIDIARVEEGRLVEEWMNWDALGLLRRLGAVPALAQRA